MCKTGPNKCIFWMCANKNYVVFFIKKCLLWAVLTKNFPSNHITNLSEGVAYSLFGKLKSLFSSSDEVKPKS